VRLIGLRHASFTRIFYSLGILFGIVAIAAASAVVGFSAQLQSPSVALSASGLPLPDPKGGFDYQLGGGYTPPAGVTIVERDRLDRPSGAGYDICYVNGFQTQPDEADDFLKNHSDLLLKSGGKPIKDPQWDGEYLFDTSTPEKRTALLAVVGPWIQGCKTAGFAAVEIDNLDSYTRSKGLLNTDANVAMAAQYAGVAHAAGLAIAQKNSTELAPQLSAGGFDFAISESCFYFKECGAFTSRYPVVLDIEYTNELGTKRFPSACTTAGRPGVMIMRDLDLVRPGDKGYYYKRC
jgi:hypothetical protein